MVRHMKARPPIVDLPPLPLLRAFEAAARTASFTAAARELNLTQAAVSYQVRALEEHLGFALFDRRPRGVTLTAMGVAYRAPVRKAFDDLAISTVGLFGSRAKAHIHVQAPVSFAALWLAPRLTGFFRGYPDIAVRLSSSVWESPAPDRAIDLEVRYGEGRLRGYVGEPLLRRDLLIACSPAVAARHGQGDLTGLIHNRVIHIMGHEAHWLGVFAALRVDDLAAVPGPTVDTTIAALELAAAGGGCVLTHRVFMESYLASGRLILPCDRTFDDPLGFHVMAPDNAKRTPIEVHLFREWLKGEAADVAA
jgi:LysR family glycine cleavage system transcriptional activator